MRSGGDEEVVGGRRSGGRAFELSGDGGGGSGVFGGCVRSGLEGGGREFGPGGEAFELGG